MSLTFEAVLKQAKAFPGEERRKQVEAFKKPSGHNRRIKKWDDKSDPLAKLDDFQLDVINQIEELTTQTTKLKKVRYFFPLGINFPVN